MRPTLLRWLSWIAWVASVGVTALLVSTPGASGRSDFAGERSEALEHIRRAPNDAAGFAELAGWLFRDGDLGRAVAAAEEAVRLQPDVAKYHRLVGYLQAVNGGEDAAEAAFRRAAELEPTARAWLADFHLAQAWAGYQDALRQGRPDAALEERVRGLGAVAELSPDLKALFSPPPVPPASAAVPVVPPIFLAPDVANAVVVEKQTQTVRLYGRHGSDLVLLQTFPCTTGRRPGAKRHRGDRRTPNGVYVISDLLHGDDLPERYGALALPLSYPNAWDRRLRRDGYGIWFHGSDRIGSPFTWRDTQGCIVLRNEDMVTLARKTRPGVTPVLLAEEVSYRPVAEWKSTVQAVLHDVPVTGLLAVVGDSDYTVVMHRNGTTVVRDFVKRAKRWQVVATERTPLMSAAEWNEKLAAVLPARPVALMRVRVPEDEQPPRVVIETSGPAEVRSYRSDLTNHLYLDLPGVRASPLPTVVPGHGHWIEGVWIAQAQLDPPLTRLVIKLRAPTQYRIVREGNQTIVSLAAVTP
ncbi:MAG: L,D-transpeptidase family protein [Candidatus Binatia bacterium]